MLTHFLPWTVLIIVLGRFCCTLLSRLRAYHKDSALGALHGCELPRELTKKWPLGIDRIKDLWGTNADGRLLAYLCKVAEDYEPHNNLTQYLLFGPRAFHVLHPSNVEAVLSTNFKDYGLGARPAIFAPLLGQGISTQEGPAWKHSRELLRKHFIRMQYQRLDHFHEHIDNLLARLPSTGVVDLQPLFFDMTLDITTAMLFGRSVYSLRAGIDQREENRCFAESFNIAQEGLAKRFRIAPWHSFYNPKSFRTACANVHRFVENYIKESDLNNSQNGERKHHGLLKQLSKDSTSTEDLRDQLVNLLLAGRDTTACCLSWTLRLLVRHPHVMKRLRAEIASTLEARSTPTRNQLMQMPYLSCIMKESLRLYPPVPLNNREAIKTTILSTGGGPEGDKPILVRKGELVVFSQYVNSRKKNIYGPDACDFRPERWETGELANVRWAYFPFSGGPRQCLGEDFAQTEIAYTIVRLLKACPHISVPVDAPNESIGSERQRLTLVLSSADGCKVEVLKE